MGEFSEQCGVTQSCSSWGLGSGVRGLGVWRRPLKHWLPSPHPTASCQFPAVGSGL